MQRSLLIAVGQTMLVEGQSRPGILLIELSCLVISAVMLRGTALSKATAYVGILGNVLLIVVEDESGVEREVIRFTHAMRGPALFFQDASDRPVSIGLPVKPSKNVTLAFLFTFAR